MIKSQFSIFAGFLALLLVAGAAQAQTTRSWVSGVGDDANPCSRTAPCKTFAGAISKTAVAGVISVLDPGLFGNLTITKSITVDGQGQLAGVTNTGTTTGFTVNAGTTDVVIIRHLSIDGAGTGLNGIRLIQAGQLIIDDVAITGNTQSGIELASTGGTRVTVTNSTLTQNAAGLRISSGAAGVLLDRVSIRGNANGVDVLSGTVDIVNSAIAQNAMFGVYAEGGNINVDSSMFSGNGTALQSQPGSVIRISGSALYNNTVGFGCGGGTLASAQNNRRGGNNTGGGTICAPNATFGFQ